MSIQRKKNLLSDLSDQKRERLERKKNNLLNSLLEQQDDLDEEGLGKKLYYDNQEETAKKIAENILNDSGIFFQLVIAETQTGKTACMIAIIQKCFTLDKNEPVINPENIYILTGVSSTDWRDQTKKRMCNTLKHKVYHRNDLKNKNEIKNNLCNALIFIDEVHIASGVSMSLDKLLIEINIKDMQELAERNINIVFISATPNGILNDMKKWKDSKIATTVVMKPGNGYTGLSALMDQKRIFNASDLYVCDDPDYSKSQEEINKTLKKIQSSIKAIENLKNFIKIKFNIPKYIIIRTPSDKNKLAETVRGRIIKIFGSSYDFLKCDSTTDNDIVNILKKKPEKHTVLFIKEQLRCAVTLEPKENIGVLYERINKSSKNHDATMVQGLAGRATGYNVPPDVYVYTSLNSIKKYIETAKDNFSDMSKITYYGHKNENRKSLAHPNTYKNTGMNNIVLNTKSNIELEHKLFENGQEQDALDFILEKFNINNMRKCSKEAPKELKNNDENPTLDYVLNRKWGLSNTNIVRQIRLDTDQICIYWKK